MELSADVTVEIIEKTASLLAGASPDVQQALVDTVRALYLQAKTPHITAFNRESIRLIKPAQR